LPLGGTGLPMADDGRSGFCDWAFREHAGQVQFLPKFGFTVCCFRLRRVWLA
jgi:hypothetical protein